MLACYPEHRSIGLGSQILRIAEQIAHNARLRRTTVIVACNETGARRLYEQHGYIDAASRACVRGDGKTETHEWVLMKKRL
ncbi:GNAT family N-acetyltransferase [Albidovulum aquaemixtae]|uniref:GNAT family N-acetyltransferase n=1 Tax=Albidovulum aquaemixtae TaxID=1542388 RepID=UPI001C63709B